MTEQQPAPPWFHKPIWQGLLGLALLFGGWKLATFRPGPAGDDRIADLREMAGDEAELRQRLDRLSDQVRGEPPYQMPGRLVLLAGLMLFVSGAVRMYQSTPPAPEKPEPGA